MVLVKFVLNIKSTQLTVENKYELVIKSVIVKMLYKWECRRFFQKEWGKMLQLLQLLGNCTSWNFKSIFHILKFTYLSKMEFFTKKKMRVYYDLKFWYDDCHIFIITQPIITCSKFTIETLEEGVKYVKWRRSGVFIVNFEHISCLVLVFLLLTLSR